MIKTLFLLAVLVFTMSIATSEVKANTLPSYEFYPQGNNYLDPDNFIFHISWPYASYYNPHYVKVKPGQEYHVSSYGDYDLSISELEIQIFDENKNYLGNISYTTTQTHNRFVVPNDVQYIKLDIYIHLHQQQHDFMYIDRYIALYEGPAHTGTFPQNDWLYQGYQLDLKPIFDYNTGIYITNINDPIDLAYVMSGIFAYDDIDGDITHLIEIAIDEYTLQNDTLGEKRVLLQVSDSAGNVSYLQLIFVILDTTTPIISGPSEITTTQHVPLTSEDIVAYFSANDNYEGDVSNALRIVRNDYQGLEETIGEHIIELDVTDTSGNRGTFQSKIIVKDSTVPVISGPSTILKNRSEAMSLEYIKSLFSASDNLDGDITEKITIKVDNYTNNHNKMGEHVIVLEVKDNANNTTTHHVTIKIADDIAPVFLIDEFIVHVDLRYEDVNILDIVNVLLHQKIFEQGDKIEIIEDEYSLHKQQSGVYSVTLRSEHKEVKLSIHVIEELQEANQEKLTVFQIIWKWIAKVILSIVNFLKSLF